MINEQPEITRKNNIICMNYYTLFDRETGENLSFYGEFELEKYACGINKFLCEGKCEVEGINGTEIALTKDKKTYLSMKSGNSVIGIAVNLEDLLIKDHKKLFF